MKSGNSCETIKNLLPMYVCNETTEEENLMIKEHLEKCEECAKEYEMLLSMERAFDEAEYETPEELHDNIMKSVKKSALKSKRHKAFLKSAVSLAATMAAVLLVFVAIPKIFIGNHDNEAIEPNKGNNEIVKDSIMFEGNFEGIEHDNGYLNLSNDTFNMFVGVWNYTFDDGNKVSLKINKDKSVEMCIEYKNGVQQYYDGMLEINSKDATLTQSDGETNYKANIEMFIKNGKLGLHVLKGAIPTPKSSQYRSKLW